MRALIRCMFRAALDPRRADSEYLVALPAHHARLDRHVVGQDPVAALGFELGLGVLDDAFGLGRETDDKFWPLGFELGNRRQDIRILDKCEARYAAAAFLDLLLAG